MMKTIKQHILANFQPDEIENIVQSGCVSGCATGLIYYSDTEKFHDENESEIWDMLYEDANDMGLSIMQFIATLNVSKDVDSMIQLKNLLVWYAVEKICWEITEFKITNN